MAANDRIAQSAARQTTKEKSLSSRTKRARGQRAAFRQRPAFRQRRAFGQKGTLGVRGPSGGEGILPTHPMGAPQHAASRALTTLAAAALAAVTLTTAPAKAQPTGNPEAGKAKAALCVACHGPDGISINPLWPSLAGQQGPYLAKQIRAFRDGERVEPTMQPFVANLTDQDVEDIAAYYASLSRCP